MLVTILIMIFFVVNIIDVHEEKSEKEICKQEIRAEAMTNVRGADWASFFKRGGERGIQCHTFYEDIETDDEDEINAKIARYMYDAWDMFHEGRLELFDATLTDRTFCVLTHHIEFKGDAKNLGEVDGFVEYLATTKIPSPTKEEMSYLEYLHCFNTQYDLESLDEFPEEDVNIDTDNDYGVMFVYTKAGELDTVLSVGTGAVAGALGGKKAGAARAVGLSARFIPGAGWALTIGGAITGGIAGFEAAGRPSADWSSCVVLFPYTEESINEFGCDYLPAEHPGR